MYLCVLHMKKIIALKLLLLLHFIAFSTPRFLLPVVNEIGKWGYIDSSGSQIIPYQFDLAYQFTEERGLVAVSVNGEYKYSFIDPNGNLIGDWKFTEAHPFNNGYALVRFFIDAMNLTWGYIDKQGNFSPPISCSDARSFNGGYAAVEKLTGWGFINKSFKETIKGQYTTVGVFSEGLCAAAVGHDSLQRWCFVNSLGQQITTFKYIQAGKFSDHLASAGIEIEEKSGRKVLKRKVYGYIGGNGDFFIPAKFEEAYDFNEGLARVKQNGIEMFVDLNGNTVITLDSAVHAASFHYGFAAVSTPDGRAYFIDKNGNIAYDYNFVSITDFFNGYSFFIKRNGTQGYLDYNGNVIWKNK